MTKGCGGSCPAEIYGNFGCRHPYVFNKKGMIRPVKHDKASRHRKSRKFKSNVSVHPFVLVAIAAALTVVVFVIVVYFLRYIK